MDEATVLNWIAAVGGALAGAGAVTTAIIALRMQGRLVKIEERRFDAEQRAAQRADLTAHVEAEKRLEPSFKGHPQERSDKFVVIANRGQAAARDVNLELEGIGPTGDSRKVLRADEDEFPLSLIDPGSSYRIGLMLHVNGPYRFLATVTWEDGAGQHRHTVPLSAL